MSMDFHTKYYYPTAAWMREHRVAQRNPRPLTFRSLLFFLQDLLFCGSLSERNPLSIFSIFSIFLAFPLEMPPVSKESAMQWMVNWPSFSSIETGAGVQGGCDDQSSWTVEMYRIRNVMTVLSDLVMLYQIREYLFCSSGFTFTSAAAGALMDRGSAPVLQPRRQMRSSASMPQLKAVATPTLVLWEIEIRSHLDLGHISILLWRLMLGPVGPVWTSCHV